MSRGIAAKTKTSAPTFLFVSNALLWLAIHKPLGLGWRAVGTPSRGTMVVPDQNAADGTFLSLLLALGLGARGRQWVILRWKLRCRQRWRWLGITLWNPLLCLVLLP